MDYMSIQIEWHEVAPRRGTLDDVLQGLQQLPAANWLSLCASISASFAARGAVESQPALFRAWSGTGTGGRAAHVARTSEGSRALVTPKPLGGLAKLALAYAPRRGVGPVADAREVFLRTYLQLCDVIADADRAARDDPDPVRNIVRFFVQEGEYGAAGGLAEPLTRIDLLLRRIPEERGLSPTPAEQFEAHAGLPLRRYLSIGGGLLAYAMAMEREDPAFTGHPFLLDPEALFRLTNVTGDERRQLFDLLVSTADDVEAIRQQDPTDASFYHDREQVRRRPLLPVGVRGEPRLIPLSVGDLAWRVTEGVYWDVADAHRELAPSNRASKRAVEGFMKEFGLSLERYLERLFHRALPGAAGLAPRFLADIRTSGSHPDNDPQIDLLFPYPDAFVVVEVKSARFHYRNSVVAGDLGHIEGPDLDKVFFGPVEQIDGAVAKLIDGAYDDDRLRYAGQPVYPVLVTYGALPTMWPAWPWLLDGIRDRGHLTQSNVRPLAALQVSEAEILAALAMRGHSVSDIVRSYVEGDRSDVSFRNYANEVYSDDADVGALLADDFSVTHDRFRELFGGESDLSTSAS